MVCDDSLPLDLRDEGVERLRAQVERNDPYAQLLLGRLYRDGPLVTPDWVEARYRFEQAAQELPDAQYALGKLLLADDVEVHDREQGICWLMQAAESGQEFAVYRLAKEFLKDGNTVEALPWLTMSAEADNPYAEYLLGRKPPPHRGSRPRTRSRPTEAHSRSLGNRALPCPATSPT